MFKFFTENSLISQNQSTFKPGHSYINQLLSITHQIYKSFDDGHEVRSVFIDISKTFDKDGTIWTHFTQWLLFFICINHLSEGFTTNVRVFAENVSLFSVVNNISLSATNLNRDLSKIDAWASPWKMTFNSDFNKQAQEVIFSRKIKKTWHLSGR